MRLHASCVAIGGAGLLITGRPGAGKSELALDLIALGATLVADDQVVLSAEGPSVLAAPPAPLAGLIEARGLGLLRLPWVEGVALRLVVDLDRAETARLPAPRALRLLDRAVPRILRPDPLRPSALWAVLRHGLPLDPDAPLPSPADDRSEPDRPA